MDDQAKAEKLRRNNGERFILELEKKSRWNARWGLCIWAVLLAFPSASGSKPPELQVVTGVCLAWALIASWGAFKKGALASYLRKDVLAPSDEKGLPIVMWLGMAAFFLTIMFAALNIGLIPSPWNSGGN